LVFREAKSNHKVRTGMSVQMLASISDFRASRANPSRDTKQKARLHVWLFAWVHAKRVRALGFGGAKSRAEASFEHD